ncbi:MAG: hypothetical protein JJT88_04025 [Gammaproteobacteria bacterium]|nr:hypothetical protein [Gammaproteobacteria bacterium]
MTRRILIALDPAAPRRDALDAVAALYRENTLEISGVFIEDDNLKRLATLPFAREIRLSGQIRQGLDPDLLRRQLDACAAEFEGIFRHARTALRSPVSFRVLHGDVLVALRQAAAETDLVVVGRSLARAGLRTWLGVQPEQLLEALAECPTPAGLLFVHEPWATGRCVLVLDDGSDTAGRAREQAEAMAAADGLPLEFCRLAGSEVDADYDEAEPVPAIADLEELRRHCQARDPRLLVLPDSAAVRERIDLRDLLCELPASVAITR